MDPLQRISEICFEESYVVPTTQTARALFGRFIPSISDTHRLADCLATAYLFVTCESVCIREMQRYVDAGREVVVGTSLRLQHRRAVPVGTLLHLRGWVEQVGERSAGFCVRVSQGPKTVCECSVTLVVVAKGVLPGRGVEAGAIAGTEETAAIRADAERAAVARRPPVAAAAARSTPLAW